ncbi:MAG: type II toxin-antitoxin system RelE/ParE family toxin [Clostridium sp.]|nr:type II toxin-antitoxin system RelE/ParE family toxin [Clostridium sp.]
MNYEISMTPQAQNDLRSIYEYIAFDLQSPQNAASQLDRLEEHIASLEEMPERCRVYDKEPWRKRNLRILSVDNYLVFYIPNHEEKMVTIIRVIYSGRDIDKQLNSSTTGNLP